MIASGGHALLQLMSTFEVLVALLLAGVVGGLFALPLAPIVNVVGHHLASDAPSAGEAQALGR